MLGTDSLTSATPAESAQAPSSKPAQTTTSESAHQPSSRTSDRWAYAWVDRRLKVLSVLLPIAFVLALEFFHSCRRALETGRNLRV